MILGGTDGKQAGKTGTKSQKNQGSHQFTFHPDEHGFQNSQNTRSIKFASISLHPLLVPNPMTNSYDTQVRVILIYFKKYLPNKPDTVLGSGTKTMMNKIVPEFQEITEDQDLHTQNAHMGGR